MLAQRPPCSLRGTGEEPTTDFDRKLIRSAAD